MLIYSLEKSTYGIPVFRHILRKAKYYRLCDDSNKYDARTIIHILDVYPFRKDDNEKSMLGFLKASVNISRWKYHIIWIWQEICCLKYIAFQGIYNLWYFYYLSAYPAGFGSRFNLTLLSSTSRHGKTFYSAQLKQIKPVQQSETNFILLIIKVNRRNLYQCIS